jgi:hypothetical protein
VIRAQVLGFEDEDEEEEEEETVVLLGLWCTSRK